MPATHTLNQGAQAAANNSKQAQEARSARTQLAVVYHAIDWLDFSTRHMLCASLLGTLAEKLAVAKSSGDNAPFSWPLIINGERREVPFEVKPYTIGHGFGYTFMNSDVVIHARSAPSALKTMPNVLVHCTNEFLHEAGWLSASALVQDVVAQLCEEAEEGKEPTEPELVISRVDLCCDFQGLDLSRVKLEHLVGQPRAQLGQYKRGAVATGVSVASTPGPKKWRRRAHVRSDATQFDDGVMAGRGGDIRMRLYDKTEEITKKSQKWWFFDIWAESPLFRSVAKQRRALPEAETPVVRLEFQLRHEKLAEFRSGLGHPLPRGIRTVADLKAVIGPLWRYLCGEPVPSVNKHGRTIMRAGWISWRKPVAAKRGGTKRVTEWGEYPQWTQLRTSGFGADLPEGRVVRVHTAKLRSAQGLYPQVAGFAAGTAARLAVHSDGDPASISRDLTRAEHWEASLPSSLAELATNAVQLGNIILPDDVSPEAFAAAVRWLMESGQESGMVSVNIRAIAEKLAGGVKTAHLDQRTKQRFRSEAASLEERRQ